MNTNHLIQEKSPYLLQHAHNPVDWYPWCREAFEEAKIRQKPIFLSIGYSTCHWCHVMEQESFEDATVAGILNRDYISIKVDREERPDVDGVYMDVCQLLTGSGGWPLTILMTPEQKPFYAGTYFPKEDRYGRIGLLSLLTQISRKWDQEQRRLYEIAEDITEQLRRQQGATEKGALRGGSGRAESDGRPRSEACMESGVRQLARMFDRKNGGFSDAPKFPVPHNLLFFMKWYESRQSGGSAGLKSSDILEMVELTLRNMFLGGIFDHIGGGFSRYSTDERWLVPHFEKMLYDNALLALAYLEAYQITGKALYLEVAERTLGYVARELTHEKGGFFCGQDADSEGEEGKYYLFTPGEIRHVLGRERGERFCRRYDIRSEGNFEGRSIPNLISYAQEDFSYREDLSYQDFYQDHKLLLEYRRERTTLHRDDKILTSWNGLAIWAFARAWQITGITAYYKQARKAAAFVRANLMTTSGRLRVRWREEEAAFEGNLSDYAFYAFSLLEMYQCDYDVSWLRTCIGLAEKMQEFFEDSVYGGYFFCGIHGEQLIGRQKETYDGAMPSGNSAAGLLLVRLYKLTGERKWQEAAKRQLAFLQTEMEGREAGHTMALMALMEQEEEGVHLVCTTDGDTPEEEIRCYRKGQWAHVSAFVITPGNQKSLAKLIPQAADYPIRQGKTMYYVCRGQECQPPVEEI